MKMNFLPDSTKKPFHQVGVGDVFQCYTENGVDQYWMGCTDEASVDHKKGRLLYVNLAPPHKVVTPEFFKGISTLTVVRSASINIER